MCLKIVPVVFLLLAWGLATPAIGQPVSNHDTLAKNKSFHLHASTLVFEPVELDMGSIPEGDKAVAYIQIRNAGKAMEQIVSIETSCGCSTAEPEQRLVMPGEFTRVKISIDTFAKQDNVIKWVELTDSHGYRSKAILHLNVLPNPHMDAGSRSIFSGKCAACHFEPAKGLSSGPEIFRAVCSMCHGEKADGGYAPSLRGHQDGVVLSKLIAEGTGSQHMPGFSHARGGPLNEKQIATLVQWLLALDE
ncbi:MAG TPA: DUF1573 domain-containing protein [Mariprofundaceae bacterium]|nr:DUF1573 domain-containing protein [Mariprofundaceae bacterium]